jgi:hypothetical protein
MNFERQKITIRLLGLGLCAAVLGCGHAKGSPDEYDGWATATTLHFDVHTPMSAAVAEAYAQQLELVYTAMIALMFPRVDLPPTEVLVFEHRVSAQDTVADSSGQSRERRPAGGVMVLIDRERHTTQRSAVNKFSTPWQVQAAHEIAARLVKQAIPHAPAWFRTGVERYLETVQVEPGMAKFGRREPLLEAELTAGRVIPLGQLLDDTNESFHHDWPRSHEASAWGFVNYLLTGEGGTLRPKFDIIAAALEADRQGNSRIAIEAAFPNVPLGALENKVRDYDVRVLGRTTMFPTLSIPLPPVPDARGTASPTATDHVRGLLLAVKPH